MQRLDGWVNTLSGLGGSRDRSRSWALSSAPVLDPGTLDTLYHTSDIAGAIVDRLPTDALSLGFSFGDKALDDAARKWKIREQVLDGRRWGRLFGAGGVLIGCRAGFMDRRLRLADVRPGDLNYLLPVDIADLSAVEYDQDAASPTFGEPLYYSFRSQRVHASRVVLFGGAPTTARRRQAMGGRDMSVLQRPLEVLQDAEHVWRSVMGSMSDLSQAVFKVRGLIQMIANGQKDVMLARMQIVQEARSVSKAVVIDAEHEDYTHVGAANLTGVDALLIRVFQRTAAAADMPLSILFGVSAAGLNATGSGDSDLRIWRGKVNSERMYLEPAILYLASVVARHEGLDMPRAITWPSLEQETDSEVATREATRATTAAARIAAGLTDPDEEARVLQGESIGTVIADRPDLLSAEADAEPVDDVVGEIEISVGSTWVDTAYGTRVRVTQLSPDRVYYQEIDSETPLRQWGLKRASFVERCMPVTDAAPPAESAPDAPPQAPPQSA